MEISILIGGEAGEGIRQGGKIIAKLLNKAGYYTFSYDDYQSLIKGGHNFTIIRGSEKPILAHKDKIDILIALNQETIEKHSHRLKENSLIIFDSNKVKSKGIGLDLTEKTRKKELPKIAKNVASLGILCSILNLNFSILNKTIKESIKKDLEKNIELAEETYNETKNEKKIELKELKELKVRQLNGNEAIAEGAVQAGLESYISYPMTPATGVLHHLAKNQEKFHVKVIQPEDEISSIGMVQGAAYAGHKSMVGSAGGGFALMIEHLSLAGQAELPTPIIVSQRAGPSTGVPTYTEQSDLFFTLYAGHGEFPRIVAAPGDAEEAYHLSGSILNLAWNFQIPTILLSDKHLSTSLYSQNLNKEKIIKEKIKVWDKKGKYQRYKQTKDGISPLTYPGEKNAVVKVNGKEHNEYGLTIDDAETIKKGHEKRILKQKTINKFMEKIEKVKTYGKESDTILITWGSTKGAVVEVGEILNLKVLQPLYLEPFPEEEIKKYTKNKKIICIELNSTGQLNKLLNNHGIKTENKILKYNGRPFTVDELEKEVSGVLNA